MLSIHQKGPSLGTSRIVGDVLLEAGSLLSMGTVMRQALAFLFISNTELDKLLHRRPPLCHHSNNRAGNLAIRCYDVPA